MNYLNLACYDLALEEQDLRNAVYLLHSDDFAIVLKSLRTQDTLYQ